MCATVAAWRSVGRMHVNLGRAGQGRAGQGRAGQGRAGQGRAGQGRAGQILMRQQANTGRSQGAACTCSWSSSHELY